MLLREGKKVGEGKAIQLFYHEADDKIRRGLTGFYSKVPGPGDSL